MFFVSDFCGDFLPDDPVITGETRPCRYCQSESRTVQRRARLSDGRVVGVALQVHLDGSDADEACESYVTPSG